MINIRKLFLARIMQPSNISTVNNRKTCTSKFVNWAIVKPVDTFYTDTKYRDVISGLVYNNYWACFSYDNIYNSYLVDIVPLYGLVDTKRKYVTKKQLIVLLDDLRGVKND